ncbi:MAG: MgtC/SapB family protein [Nanoarchaeota archaeon]|nr:MgtC/SapB family protein [Nanoarchaeota archaeon]
MLYQFLQEFVLSVMLAALVGVEREHARQAFGKKKFPIFGIRTTILFGLLGFLTAFVAGLSYNPLFMIVGLVLALVVTTSVYVANAIVHKHTGATTYISMFVVFFTGMFVGFGGYANYLIAVILAVATTFVLAAKRKMVRWSRKLTNEDIMSAIKFAIIAFIIFPLLPNEFIDPWHMINPYKIWYVVVAISAIYFVSYVLMKELSHLGLVVSSFFGGLVNSSATVYQIADWLKKQKSLLHYAISSAFLACFTGQLGDLIVIVFVFGGISLFKVIALPYMTSMAILLIASFVSYKLSKKKVSGKLKIKSPFSLKPVLEFGLFYFGLVIFGGMLNRMFGGLSLLPLVVGGSLFSSSTVIASLTNMVVDGDIAVTTSAEFVLLAASISLLVKSFWIQKARNKKFSKIIIVGTLLAAASMFVVFFLQQFLVN